VVVSSAIFILAMAGWRGSVWLWVFLGVVVAVTARSTGQRDGHRPDAADGMAMLGWALPFAVEPGLLAHEAGGWMAPALIVMTARQLGSITMSTSRTVPAEIGPPLREVRGTLSLRLVVPSAGGLPATVPIDLDLRAGESLAILCDDQVLAQSLADVLSGRVRPHSGEVLVDGAELRPGERLVSVIAPGEGFVPGSLDGNLAVSRDDEPDRATIHAARDACGLSGVIDELDGRPLAADGSPLSPFHRSLVLAARALVSHCRILVVVDGSLWIDARSKAIWRAAVVRASVGRTAIWITDDAELADRADHVHDLVDGAMRTS
jgi:ABC-type transport system involved in cytochrome bd biosynthesis fused ATPase/permease subunit